MNSSIQTLPGDAVPAASPEFRIAPGAGRIRTPRLHLVSATAALLRAELEGPDRLAAAIGLHVPPDWPPELYDADAVAYSLAAAEAREGPPRWGQWYFAEAPGGREPVALVGVGGFHAPPGESGEVEVGYSLLPHTRGKGYATEAVRALVAYAFADPGVRRVVGETLPHLDASIRVMLRAGFAPADDPSSPEVVRYARVRGG